MIQAMTALECRALLQAEHVGRLGCSLDGKSYVVPISYTYAEGTIYSLATVGRKIEWMRANPSVCLQVDRINNRFDWHSAVVSGMFEEIPGSDDYERDRQLAWEVLSSRPNWWEPAYTETVIDGVKRPLQPVYFRIRISDVSGRRMTSARDDAEHDF